MKLLPRFPSIRTLFKKKKTQAPALSKAYDDQFYQDLLTGLKEQQKPLHIQFVNSAQDFISMILEVNAQKKTLIIDELNSPEGHELAIRQVPFVATAQHHGVSVYFSSRVARCDSSNGIYFYELKFPERIEYLQRRKIPRIVVDSDSNFTAEFFLSDHPQIKARIEDFSVSGVQFSLPRNMRPIFKGLERIDNFRLIPGFLPAKSFVFVLKHIRYDVTLQRTFVGGQFINLDNEGLKHLSMIQMRLQK